MTPLSAFEAGSGVASDETSILVSAVGCVFILLFAAWSFVSVYRGWSKGHFEEDVMISVMVRSIVAALVVFWLLLS